MKMPLSRFLRSRARVSWPIVPAVVAGLLAGGALAAGPYVISQKNREFQPARVVIKRGEILRFVNDDGELLHHAYLTNDKFSFDSGDQQPGSKFEVSFPVTGTFNVLCAIHPKMKLVVEVRE